MYQKFIYLRKMIAFHYKGKVAIFTVDDFWSFINFTAKKIEINSKERSQEFMSCATRLRMGLDPKSYKKFEKVFLDYYYEDIGRSYNGEVTNLKVHYLFKGEDAKKYLYDYLYVYRFLTKKIDFKYEKISAERNRGELLRVSERKPQNLMDRFFRRLGSEIDHHYFLMSSVSELYGSMLDLDFFLKVNVEEYRFNKFGFFRVL